MESERQYPDEEQTKEGLIDLSSLTAEFCSDDDIREYLSNVNCRYKDKDLWIRINTEFGFFETQNKSILKDVEDGKLKDTNSETIWQFKVDEVVDEQQKFIQMKKEIFQMMDEVMIDVAKSLGKFLPDWKLPHGPKIFFTLSGHSDYRLENDTNIIVNLKFLINKTDRKESLRKGLTHELFHLWMNKDGLVSVYEDPLYTEKQYLINRTINEGLACLLSGDSLKEHHEGQGTDYQEFINLSFAFYNNTLAAKDIIKLKEKIRIGLKNMGYIYVVGHVVVSTILKHDGMEKFKEFILQAPKNPSALIQRYKEICELDKDLPKIY
jgi:hypothetical protein